MEQQLQIITLSYSRNSGFKHIENLDNLTTEPAAEFIRNYVTKLEKDVRLRDVTQKTIIRILLGIAVIVLVLLLVLANFLSALICFAMLVALSYFLGYLQAKKLRKTIADYNLMIAGSDWEYFGCYIENRFGHHNWKYYAFLPFIKPSLDLYLKLKPKPLVPLQTTPTANRAVPAAVSIKDHPASPNLEKRRQIELNSQGGIPIKEKSLKGSINSNRKFTDAEFIDIGQHDDNVPQKEKEKEKLFS